VAAALEEKRDGLACEGTLLNRDGGAFNPGDVAGDEDAGYGCLPKRTV